MCGFVVSGLGMNPTGFWLCADVACAVCECQRLDTHCFHPFIPSSPETSAMSDCFTSVPAFVIVYLLLQPFWYRITALDVPGWLKSFRTECQETCHPSLGDGSGIVEPERLEVDAFLMLGDRLVLLHDASLSAADPRTNQMQGIPESLYKAGCIQNLGLCEAGNSLAHAQLWSTRHKKDSVVLTAGVWLKVVLAFISCFYVNIYYILHIIYHIFYILYIKIL